MSAKPSELKGTMPVGTVARRAARAQSGVNRGEPHRKEVVANTGDNRIRRIAAALFEDGPRTRLESQGDGKKRTRTQTRTLARLCPTTNQLANHESHE
jgi:hypothetical protein